MKTLTKILTSLALAAAGAFPAAAFGVSGKAIAAEAGGAFLYEVADFVVAGAVAGLGGYTGGGAYGATAVVAAYPFAAALGCHVGAGAVGEGAPNRGEAIGYATLAAYGETALLGGVVLVLDATHRDVKDVYMNDIYLGIFLFDVFSKPFLVTYVYNNAKKAAPAGEEGRVSFEPYVCTIAGEDGRAVPVYGLTFSF